MTFFAFGLNHKRAPVAVREAFALDAEATRSLYQRLRLSPDAEIILLSTCNRTEAYVYGARSDIAQIQEQLAAFADTPWPEETAFHFEDEEAIRHILQVAAGLRSQVLGDNQILAQVKDAYRLAVEVDGVDTVMHRLMHTAFRAAKQIVTDTALAEGSASISGLAVSVACSYFGRQNGEQPLENSRVLLLGAGEMGQGVLKTLTSYPLASLCISNRSDDRARRLAGQTGAKVIAWGDRYKHLEQFDLVIAATAASTPILQREKMPVRSSGTPELLLVDIALPRNVDPSIDEQAGYKVLDLDMLNQRLTVTEQKREAEVPQAELVCEAALSEFVTWVFHQQALQPAIETLRQTFEVIRRQEVERYHERLQALDQEELDRITRSIMQKLLAVPIVRLKDAANNDLDLAQRVELLHTLFAQPSSETAADINAMDECPYLHDHMEQNKMWRPVADYMRKLTGSVDGE